MASTTQSGYYVCWGVEDGQELCYVDAGPVQREFVIDSDTDFQLDLYKAGLSPLEIREVMADVRYCRAQGVSECDRYCPIDDFVPPRTERAARREARREATPADDTDAAGGASAGFDSSPTLCWTLWAFGVLGVCLAAWEFVEWMK